MHRAYIRLMALLAAATPSVTWAQQSGQNYGPHMWNGGWPGWFFGPMMMIVVIAVAVIVVVLLVRWLGGPSHGTTLRSPPGKTSLDILKERFARGEIDKEEFEERRKTLGD